MCATLPARTGMIRPRFDTLRHTLFTILRHLYAWPGGYAYVAIMRDGEPMCAKCVRGNVARIARATREPEYATGWELEGYATTETFADDPLETCCNCYRPLSEL